MKSIPARIRLPIVLTALATVASAASAETNLLTNPGFEDGGGSYDGWTILFGTGPNISTPATDNIFRSGSAASKIFGEFSGCPIPNFDVGGYGQFFPPTAGQIYDQRLQLRLERRSHDGIDSLRQQPVHREDRVLQRARRRNGDLRERGSRG
jgi:hypothetical protein